MNNLAERAQRGDDARVLLLGLLSTTSPDWSGEQCLNFKALLDINTPEAHLAAAMMLVRKVWRLALEQYPRGNGLAELFNDETRTMVSGEAPTPAHALIAALSHMENQNEG